MNGTLRKLLPWLCAGLTLALVAAGLGYWQFLRWADTPLSDETQTFYVDLQPGGSLSALAADLQARERLQNPRLLVLLGRLTGADRRLQAGEYAVGATVTPRELLDQLTSGAVITYSFRIEEGITIGAVLAALALETPLTHEVQATDAQALHAELNLQTRFAEGVFFPDTYQYRRGDSDRDVLLRAHRAMLDALEEVWQTRAVGLAIDTPEDVLILASIIEKETGLATDRTQISQVFHKRLQDRMRLQTDPTVIYALGNAFDGNLTRAHLRIDSPFNTYRYSGLPPTPIALPSAASLHAAVQPASGDFLYFVAKGDGSSQFSRTLAEHNRAVRRYQLNGGGE